MHLMDNRQSGWGLGTLLHAKFWKKSLTLSLPRMIKTEFLLTISIQYQVDK